MIGKPYEEQLRFRNEQIRYLTKDYIIGKFDEYVKTVMEIERGSYDARKGDSMQRFLEYLNQKNQGLNQG